MSNRRLNGGELETGLPLPKPRTRGGLLRALRALLLGTVLWGEGRAAQAQVVAGPAEWMDTSVRFDLQQEGDWGLVR